MNSAINGRALSGLTGLSLAHANTLVVNLALATVPLKVILPEEVRVPAPRVTTEIFADEPPAIDKLPVLKVPVPIAKVVVASTDGAAKVVAPETVRVLPLPIVRLVAAPALFIVTDVTVELPLIVTTEPLGITTASAD